jgi:hypothetical protein
MEEDDDNFLDGVIEFGDGRQYKIQPAEAPAQPGPHRTTSGLLHHLVKHRLVPVSKEERFADDDYDRSWPRSKTSPAMPPRNLHLMLSIQFLHHLPRRIPLHIHPKMLHECYSMNGRTSWNRIAVLTALALALAPHPLHRKASHAEAGIPHFLIREAVETYHHIRKVPTFNFCRSLALGSVW